MFLLLFVGAGLLSPSNTWRILRWSIWVWQGSPFIGRVILQLVRPGQLPVPRFRIVTSGLPWYILFAVLRLVEAFVIGWTFQTLTRPEIASLLKHRLGSALIGRRLFVYVPALALSAALDQAPAGALLLQYALPEPCR